MRKDDYSDFADEAQYRKVVGSLLYLTTNSQIPCMLLACLQDSCIMQQINTMELLREL